MEIQLHSDIDITVDGRRKIGFTGREKWTSFSAVYTDDQLLIAGHSVMQEWETEYMRKLAVIVCRNGGHILEIGYGMGISARFIQQQPHKLSHTIIECHPDVTQKCQTDFADEIKSGCVKLLIGFWQDVTVKIPSASYDGILFDTYPLTEEEIHCNHYWFFNEACRLLKPNGIFTYFSDEATDFSLEHRDRLLKAGFTNISGEICSVRPPENLTWNSQTILAPIISK